MDSMRINVMISMPNYMKSLTLRQDRKLSGIINNFLTNYFKEDIKYSDLFNAKMKAEQELKEAEKKVTELASTITIIDSRLKEQKVEQDKEGQESLRQTEIKSKVIKNSGIFDDIGL